ncbi:MAG: high-affinity branched-chain amino acid ABC transporter substrate-binding protein [Gammaproteobacteria bacterium]|nr:high-affinity branched-chain amino acid ABC transporter substrate-binding protein [Gammaproteobacteria bacterium]
MKKTLLSAIVASTLAFSAQADDTIKIALAGPTTGALTQYGKMQNVGAEMAIEKLNAAGGLNGKKMEAVIYDDACEPKQAVTVANQIVNDGVRFVIGHLCSSSTIPAAKIYDEEGIVMITPASTSPELSQKGYETIFRTIGLDTQTTPIAAEYIATKAKPKKIAVLHDKQQYGQGLAEGVKAELKKRGIEVDFFEGVNKGQTDFSALITKLKKQGIDFVYWGGYHPEFSLIVRQGADQGFSPQYMGSDGISNDDVFAIAGDAAKDILVTIPTNFTSKPENAGLVKAFKDKEQDASGPFVMPAYSAIQVIVDTANELKTDESEKIAEALHKGKSYKTPIGSISFQVNGDLKAFPFAVYKMNKNSKELIE